MKTIYTAPSISSVSDNEITDLAYVELYLPRLRLVQLKGVPIRLTINKDKYIELNSTEEEVDISKYSDCLKNVMEFFYGTAHLYAYVDNGKLSIYDIFTNDNYLSTKDMEYLEKTYKIPIVKPIAEGTFAFNYLIEILNKKINGEGLDASSFHLFPCMYLDDDRYGNYTPKVITKIVIGEKPNPEIAYGRAPVPAATTSVSTTPKPVTPAKPLEEVFALTTKEERVAIYKEMLKNVNNYVEKNKTAFTVPQLDWWHKYGMKFAHALSIHTLPKTRHIIYDYCNTFGGICGYWGRTNVEKWAEILCYFFQDKYENSIMKGHNFMEDYFEPDKFAVIFKEELEELDKFYVAENDAKNDWRYSAGGVY